jgi:hypothetical protein
MNKCLSLVHLTSRIGSLKAVRMSPLHGSSDAQNLTLLRQTPSRLRLSDTYCGATVFCIEAQLPGRQPLAQDTSAEASHKRVSGQPVNSDRSLDTTAFMGTDQDAPRPVSFDNVSLCSKSSGLQGLRRERSLPEEAADPTFAVVVRWGRSTVGARRSVGASDTESDTCRAYGGSARLSSQDSSTRVDVDCAQDF